MRTYKLIHTSSGKSCTFTVLGDNLVNVCFHQKSMRLNKQEARQMYARMRQGGWEVEKIEAALTAIAMQSNKALVDWLLRYDSTYTPCLNLGNNTLWVAGVASAEPYNATNLKLKTLRFIRAESIIGERASLLARDALLSD